MKWVPWNKALLYFDYFRRRFFSVEVPSRHPEVYVEEDYEDLREMFRKEHFMVSWPFSYNYEGEVMNVMRPEYEDDEYNFYQTHVRAFESEDGYYLLAHHELDPTDYPKEHLDEVNYDVPKGVEILEGILSRNDIDYEIKDE